MQTADRYQLLIDSIPDYAIYMLDATGHVTTWNPGARRFKGYEAAEIIGRHFSLFYVPEDRQAGMPGRSLAIAAEEGRFEKEGWRVRQDGSRFWAHVIIDAIRDEAGVLIGFAKITRDITEKMEAQRSLDAAREALFQSQKMEAVGQLTGGVAHDFNNLLTAILGSLELLRKKIPPDPKAQRLLDNALQGVQRGAALTQRMLAFARRQDLRTEAVNVSDLVNGMSELLQRSLGPMVRMELCFPAGLPPIEVDAHQLESALLNLAVNARDAMPAGGSLVISARRESTASVSADGLEPGTYVCLAVVDTGDGMDESTLRRAAEPFFTTKGVGKGTGLGLSMVHGMVQQLGGKLRLLSTIGQGTTAELWLPVSSRAVIDGCEIAEQVATSGRSLHILTVDDDVLVLTNLAAMLEDLGHSVVQASSGPEALKILEEGGAFDLLVTDHAMPHMTGYSLGETVLSTCPGMHVLLVSGFAELPNEANPLFARLAKPFSQHELATAIAQTMAGEPARQRVHP